MLRCKTNCSFVFALLMCLTAQADEPTLKVAVVSPTCKFGDVSSNLNHFKELIEQAATEDVRLVCFPELALVSYSTHRDVLKYAEPIPGPTTSKLEAIASEYNVFISVGMAERDGDQHHIAQIVVGPEGYLGKYRKSYPTGSEQACGFVPGKQFPTWDVDGFKFGVIICADGRQPETIEAMKSAHVDVIHHPHGNYVGSLGRDAEEWTRSKSVYVVPRSVFARAYTIVNNSAGDTEQPDRTYEYSSGALVLDPLGQVVQRTLQNDRSEKMIVVTLQRPESLIPPGEMKILRRDDPIFASRFDSEDGSTGLIHRANADW